MQDRTWPAALIRGKTPSGVDEGKVAKAVRNALSVLFAIAEMSEGDTTLTRIARQLGLPKASVLRILVDLEAQGLIVRDAERSIQLGFSVLTLASAFHTKVPLAQRCLPHLRRLRDQTEETAALQIILGQQRSCIQQVESASDVRWAVPVGRSYPIASGAAGKVLLAYTEETRRDALLGGEAYKPLTARSKPDLGSFKAEMEDVRRQGYALSENETRMGASAAAAPVRDNTGAVVAAMTVAGPSDRVTPARLRILAKSVVAAANKLSEELGWNTAHAKRAAKAPSTLVRNTEAAQMNVPASTRSARPRRTASQRPSRESAEQNTK